MITIMDMMAVIASKFSLLLGNVYKSVEWSQLLLWCYEKSSEHQKSR